MHSKKHLQKWFDSEARFSASIVDNVDDLPLVTLEVKRIQPRTYKKNKDYNDHAFSLLNELYNGEHLMIEPGSLIHLSKTLPKFNTSSNMWECKREELIVARVESFFYKTPQSHLPTRNGVLKIFGFDTEI